MEASPVLLEPIVNMKVTVPDKYTGDVMGDLNKRRGRVLGMTPDHGGNTVVEADVPMLEIYGYSTDLRKRDRCQTESVGGWGRQLKIYKI